MMKMKSPSNSLVIFYICLAVAVLSQIIWVQIAWFLIAAMWVVRTIWFEDDTFDKVNDSAKRSKQSLDELRNILTPPF